MLKRIQIVVSGKVQGVFFRASAREKARELGLRGFVKNEADGSVYIEAVGPEENLKKFTGWCYVGPSKAMVTDVQVKEAAFSDFSSFEILR